jgi:hypothetical protein
MRGEERRMEGFGVESEENISFGRPRHMWEDNIEVDIQVVEWGKTGLIWDRLGARGVLRWVR